MLQFSMSKASPGPYPADGGRPGANIADGKAPRGARFERIRLAVAVPASRFLGITARHDEAVGIAHDLRRQPAGHRVRADENEHRFRIPAGCRAGPAVEDLDRLEPLAPIPGNDLGSRLHPYVRFRRDLLDEVLRH